MDEAEYNIREAQIGDVSAACRCLEALYAHSLEYNKPFHAYDPDRLREMLEARVRTKNSVVYLLECDGVMSGIIVASISRFDGRYVSEYGNLFGRITEIYLAPEARNQGFAQALHEKAEEWFLKIGVSYIEADILTGNIPSERFFSSVGYSDLGRTVYKVLGRSSTAIDN